MSNKNNNTTSSNVNYYAAEVDPDPNVHVTSLMNIDDIDDFSFLYRNKEYSSLSGLHDSDNSPEHIESIVPQNVIESRDVILKAASDEQHPVDILIVDTTMINKYVNDNLTQKIEGTKIINYLKKILIDAEQNCDKIYDTLYFTYYDKYVHVLRNGFPLMECITHNLLEDSRENPKLKKIGSYVYDKPINYNVLRRILTQSQYQDTIEIDNVIFDETKYVLGQEYIICITPEPRFQMWCFIKLIKLWYGDVALQNNIRKIKLLVNQWQAKSNENFNKKTLIRPSICIFPRYGKKSAKIVLKRIIYHFSLLYDALGWKSNCPSYFKKINKLISWTNCGQMLKLYYKQNASTNTKLTSPFYQDNVNIITSFEDTSLIEEYVPLISIKKEKPKE